MEEILKSLDLWYSQNHTNIWYVIFILIGALVAKFFGDTVIRKAVTRGVKHTAHKNPREEKLRQDTIVGIISGALAILIWPVALMLVLGQLGVNIAPLIAGAGIVGLALGFGAQSLVKDIISGLFIIIENQYRIGDIVQLGGVEGLVERITLRATVLRDLDGAVHHIPNGTINTTSNLSKDYSGINLDIGVAYDTDLEKAIKIINHTGKKLSGDAKWKDLVVSSPKFLRVNDFSDKALVLKVVGKAEPTKQWEVAGELRRRLKIAFDKNNISLAAF